MSTSNDPGQAFRFGPGGFTSQTFSGAQNSNNRISNTEATVFWSIDVPAGSKALSLPYGDEVLSNEAEKEVILPKGTTLRVKAIRRVAQEGTDNAYNYYIDAEVVPVVAEQKQEVVDAPTVKQFDDLSNYKRISGPLGSNDGGVYENEGGVKIYVKEPRSELHGENEVLASKLYERLGIETVEIQHGRLANGTEVTYSYWINAESDLRERLDDPVYLEKLQEGFAVDAWIANWDVAGSAYDNIVSDANSNPVRVDPGGALLFRARGEPKGGAFNDSANEIDTLADGTNPQSAEVFGSMTEEQKKKAAARLKWITPKEIEELVGSQISDPNVAESLAQTLIARRQNILERFGLDKEEEGGWISVDGVETIGDSPLFDDGRLTDTEFEASDLGDLTPIPTDFSQTPDDQIDALLGYTREDYDSINSILRGESLHPKQQQRFNELSKLIERIDKTFESQAPIEYGKTVFRGLIFYNPELATLFENLRPGDEYVEPAYLSTSTNPLSARGFSMMRDENPSAANASNHNVKEAQGTAFLAINLPNGSKALSLSEISEHETEGEILLPRGSRLKIEGIRRVKQNRKDGAEYYNYYVEASLVSGPVEVDAPTVEEVASEADSSSSEEKSILDKALSGEDLVFDYTALPSPDLEPLDLNKVTDEQRSAMFKYVSTDYRTINTYLRSDQLVGPYGEPIEFENLAEQEKFADSTLDIVRNLDILISQFGSLEEPVTVYRGVQITKDDEPLLEMFRTLKPGDSFVDEGYTSTSKLAKYAHGMGKSDLRENAFLVINIPAGGNALSLPVRVTEGEEEVLLPRRTEFKVKDVKTVPRVSAYGEKYDQYFLEVDVVVPEKSTQTGIFQEYGEAGKNAVEDTPLSELGFDPEEEITIYRGVPKGIKDINPGDWVTALPQLAKDYAGGDGEVISMKVKVKDLLSDPSSGEGGYTDEMVYRPAVEEPKVFDSMPSEVYYWLDNNDGPETLTSEQKTTLNWYQGDGAFYMNSYLRDASPDKSAYISGIDKVKTAEGIKVMDSIMSESKGVPSDVIVYRTIRSNEQLKLDDLSVGSIVNDPGYLSTSVSKSFVKLFLGVDTEGFIFKLTVPKGTKAIAPYSKTNNETFKHELELLLERDSNIEITNIDYQNRIVEGVVSVNPKTDPEPENVDVDGVEEAPATRTISTVADLVENYEELASRIEEIERSSESKVEKGDVPMRALMEMLGKGGKPEMVDPSVLAGRKIFYRGGPELAIDSLKYSATDRIGLGVYGNGYYFSDNPVTAEVYSAMGPGGIDAGAIASAVWKPTAKVYDLDDLDIKLPPGYTIKMYLYTIANEAKERALEELNFPKKMTDSQRAIYKLFFSDQDVDAFATKLILDGYDGLSFTFEGKHRVQEKYTIVFNREALQIADI
jgi:hypothetical protein